MTDKLSDENNNKEESFADLFESFSSGMNEDIQIGDMIKGEIISIGRDTIFVDTGSRIDGVVEKEEMLDENRELPYKEGDTLELFVIAYSSSGIRLSKIMSAAGGASALEDAFENAIPVEGKVLEECKGGFRVEVMKKKAFCPISQIALKYVEDTSEFIGESYEFLITQFEEDGRNIVVSRRDLLQKELENAKTEFFKEVSAGSQVEGRVTKLMPFGAFVELFPGIEGMVHISEISWSRVEKPEDQLNNGDVVIVKVLGIEHGNKPNQTKISLSIKQVEGDPWEKASETFQIGDKISGKVTRCVKFGAFVEIAPGIEGLVHISEITYRKRVLKVEDVLTEAQSVDVKIKDIDINKRRISLSMKDVEGDPWVDINNRFKVGQLVNGIIEKKERFGYFIELEPGITGLLPKSRIESTEKPALIEKLNQGDSIKVKIDEIRSNENRISLGLEGSVGEDDWKGFADDSGKSMGSLGEKLQQAMKKKKG